MNCCPSCTPCREKAAPVAADNACLAAQKARWKSLPPAVSLPEAGHRHHHVSLAARRNRPGCIAPGDAGVASLWVMDYFFQIRMSGLPPESPMPEAYATLAFLGGLTRRIRLGTLVTSVAYRHPGVLVKAVTALDVLTGGRMIFGVGAGAPWNIAPAGPGTASEAEGLGIPFLSLAERFERLEGLLQIAQLPAAPASADPDRRQR